ncbi:MAG: glycosyltransferase family 1 protein [Sphingobacteriaceae bacterium]|nr:glycosyltransferase family 1 protein [Sphingobacteriaceae bacterium]
MGKENIGEFFKPDEEIVTYKTAAEAIDKIKMLLKNDNLRKTIASHGQKRTLTEYSYKERMKELANFITICTQTYNFIYDFQDAIKGSYFLLKPGGTLLATVACMSPISKYDADRWGDFWRFTPQSAQKAMEGSFIKENILIEPLGNSAAAALFMKGYALEEIIKEVELDKNDEIYPLIIGIKATK